MLELIVNNVNNVEDIVLVENGKIIEHYKNSEENKKRRLEGNIYVSEVKDIISGMQAAFIDFGVEKNGFIHLKDVIPQVDEKIAKVDLNINIKDVLNSKQKLLVQVKKDSDEKKGARVSTHISLPGKYIVLMPKAEFITVSQKIEDKDKKNELLNFVRENLPKGFGAIIRTSAVEGKKEDILKDMNTLLDEWKNIETKFNKTNKKCLIWQSENITEKIITDLTNNKIEKITTNSEAEYERLKKYEPDIKVIFEKNDYLLSKYDLDKQIEKLENRKIWLNCGGFITIDKTEALTAIDVNTGKFTGKNDLEATIFKVNKEATIEIAKQLKLRDIGGIIIIDYIDMHNLENKAGIEDLLKKELKKDRAKTQVEGFTKLNLMELTRKHICSNISEK